MSKKRLQRIEEKLDLIILHLGIESQVQAFGDEPDDSIPGGGIKPPKKDKKP